MHESVSVAMSASVSASYVQAQVCVGLPLPLPRDDCAAKVAVTETTIATTSSKANLLKRVCVCV